MRLADRHGVPLSRVLSEYPSWELGYWAAWMAREPSDGRRVEWAVARLHSQYIAVHSKKGARVPKPNQLIIPDYWSEKARMEHERASRADVNTIISGMTEAGLNVRVVKQEAEYIGDQSR